MKTTVKVIAYVLVALIVAGAIGLVYKFTNGFNEDFKTFYVEYGGRQILTADSKLTLRYDETHTFNVKYTFDNEKSEPKDYKVKVLPNVTRDFDYTVNGEKYLFSKTGEFTSAFGLKKEQSQFSLTLAKGFGLQIALETINSGKKVVLPRDAETNNPYPFKLVVSSYNEKVVYNIELKIIDPITDVDLNPDGIIFNGGDNSETPPKNYAIHYLIGGDGTNLTNLNIVSPSSATAGEIVTFYITGLDSNYQIVSVEASVMGAGKNPTIIVANGGYQFEMPATGIDIFINLEYIGSTTATLYEIWVDSLGWASLDVVNLTCPDRAAAGEKVTFSASVKSEYRSEYKISGINVEFSSGDSYIEDLQPVNGVYTFIMPDAADMEEERYINLMFYIIPIDM